MELKHYRESIRGTATEYAHSACGGDTVMWLLASASVLESEATPGDTGGDAMVVGVEMGATCSRAHQDKFNYGTIHVFATLKHYRD